MALLQASMPRRGLANNQVAILPEFGNLSFWWTWLIISNKSTFLSLIPFKIFLAMYIVYD